MSNEREIPKGIKREVRQRCGFGCIICGMPIYEYHHMVGWAKVHKHESENITLLCDRHHREFDSGLLPLEEIIKANKNPDNILHGTSSNYPLHYSGDYFEIIMGNIKYIAQSKSDHLNSAIIVDMHPLLGFQVIDGKIQLFLRVYDENNSLLLFIDHNELIYNIKSWDIEFKGNNLIVREKSRKIIIDILFKTPNNIIIKRGRLMYNGAKIIFTIENLSIGKTTLSGFLIRSDAGIIIGPKADHLTGFHLPNVERNKYK